MKKIFFFRFSAKSIKLSRSEAFAVITSFVECFKYATLMNCTSEDTCKSLLKDQVILKTNLNFNQYLKSIK